MEGLQSFNRFLGQGFTRVLPGSPKVDKVVVWVWNRVANLTCQMNFEGGMQDVGYDSALSLIIDIRTVIPGSGTTAPVGWAALPLFQTGPGRYMASGYYHVPIFKVC